MARLFGGGACVAGMASAILPNTLGRCLFSSFFPFGNVLFVVTSFVVIGVWTIMYTEIFFLSRSLLLVVLMHAMEDALNPLISDGFAVVSPDKALLVSPSFGLIPLLLYLVIGLWLRRIRKSSARCS